MQLSRNTKRRLVFYGTLVGLIAFAAVFCTAMPGRSFRGPLGALDAREQRYVTELRADVRTLAETIGRRDTTRADSLHAASDALVASLRAAGYDPKRHPYTTDAVSCDNLDVEIPGDARPTEIVLIGAHYDAVVGVPGADDNASGAAAILALARAFHGKHVARTLRFALFTNEEPPHFWNDDMGSLVYAREVKARGENVVAMLSLESIAYFSDAPGSQHYPPPIGLLYPSRGDFIAFVGNIASRSLTRHAVDLFRKTAHVPSEGAALPAAIPGIGWSDQWAFWQVGYPGVMVTDTAPFRNPNYHRASDVPATLDYERFARVVAGIEDVVAALANE